jgi:hypothetical protein
MSEKVLYIGIGVALGWFVLPMVLGMFKGHAA